MSGSRQIGISLLRSAGVDIRRKPPALIRSNHELGMTVEFAAAHLDSRNRGRGVVLCQIGAYDGKSNDPIADAIERFQWRAILVEPQPVPFAALEDLYGRNPRVQLYNVAIAEADGCRRLHTVSATSGLPAWTHQVASFDPAHVRKFQRYLPGVDVDGVVVSIEVPTWTFDTLLRRAGSPNVDVLQIDAEGYDLELLRMFNIPQRQPAIVNYEHEHLSRADRRAAAGLLLGCGYRLAMSNTGDTLAYRGC